MKTLNENQFTVNRKKILYDQRYTMKRLAIDLGVSNQAVFLSIHARTQSLKMHRLIAQKLGVSLVEFWPELYGVVPSSEINVSKVFHDSKINEINESVNS